MAALCLGRVGVKASRSLALKPALSVTGARERFHDTPGAASVKAACSGLSPPTARGSSRGGGGTGPGGVLAFASGNGLASDSGLAVAGFASAGGRVIVGVVGARRNAKAEALPAGRANSSGRGRTVSGRTTKAPRSSAASRRGGGTVPRRSARSLSTSGSRTAAALCPRSSTASPLKGSTLAPPRPFSAGRRRNQSLGLDICSHRFDARYCPTYGRKLRPPGSTPRFNARCDAKVHPVLKKPYLLTSPLPVAVGTGTSSPPGRVLRLRHRRRCASRLASASAV